MLHWQFRKQSARMKLMWHNLSWGDTLDEKCYVIWNLVSVRAYNLVTGSITSKQCIENSPLVSCEFILSHSHSLNFSYQKAAKRCNRKHWQSTVTLNQKYNFLINLFVFTANTRSNVTSIDLIGLFEILTECNLEYQLIIKSWAKCIKKIVGFWFFFTGITFFGH